MKYLLLVAIALVVFWLLRSKRETGKREESGSERQPRPRPDAAKPAEMVACSVCGVHLPRSDALIGSSGIYCSEAHRRQAKG